MSTLAIPPRRTPLKSPTEGRVLTQHVGHADRNDWACLSHGAGPWSCWESSTAPMRASPADSRVDSGASTALASRTEETSAELQACIAAGLAQLSFTLQRLGDRHRKDLQELGAVCLDLSQPAFPGRPGAARAVQAPPSCAEQPVSEGADALFEVGPQGFRVPLNEGPNVSGESPEHVVACTPNSMGICGQLGSQSQQPELSHGESHLVLDMWRILDEEAVARYLQEQDVESNVSNIASGRDRVQGQRSSAYMSRPSSRHISRSSSRSSELGTCLPDHCSDTLHPQSFVRLLWNVSTIAFVLYDILMVPLHAFELPDYIVFLVIDFACNLFWTLDIAMSFKTAIYIGPHLETRWHKVIRHYVGTWFLKDLVIVVAGWTHHLASSYNSNVVKLVRLLRLFRVLKVLRSAKTLEQRVNSDVALLAITIAKILISLVILIHLLSCAWYFLGESQSNGWTKEDHMKDAGLFYRYFAAARWTIAQLSLRTDIELRTAAEYLFTCVVCLVGLVVVSACISQVTNVGIELGRLNNERSARMRLMHAFLHRHTLSTELTNAVMWYFKEMRSVRSEEQEQWNNLEGLPHHIHMEVLSEVHCPVLSSHPFFFDIQSEFPRLMYQICTKIVQPLFVQEQDHLFAPGDACSRMLFVSKGRLQYVLNYTRCISGRKWNAVPKTFNPPEASRRNRVSLVNVDEEQELESGMPVARLRRGNWISEAALWCRWETCGSLYANTDAALLAIEAHSFGATVTLFRNAHIRAQLYAAAFIKKLGDMEQVSDMFEPAQKYLQQLDAAQ